MHLSTGFELTKTMSLACHILLMVE